jgi:hypothetical protein
MVEIFAIQVIESYRWPEDVLRTYSTVYEKTHHLREIDPEKWGYEENPDEILFTVIRPFEGQQRRLLIQGDSWGEQVTQSPFSHAVVEDFARLNDWGAVSAGTTSYSASPMTTQFQVLRDAYGLDPTDVLVFFDQTDLGDELCRYKDRRRLGSNGELLAVSPEPLTSSEVYTVSRGIEGQKILSRDHLPSILRWGWYAVDKRMRKRELEERKCGWAEITRPLRSGISDREFAYLVDVFQTYLETVLGNPSTRNLVIAVHPHKDHLLSDGSYDFGIGDVVAAAVEASKHKAKIKIFDGGSIYGNPLPDADVEAMFKQEDCSCHLTDEVHSEYLENLLSTLP